MFYENWEIVYSLVVDNAYKWGVFREYKGHGRGEEFLLAYSIITVLKHHRSHACLLS